MTRSPRRPLGRALIAGSALLWPLLAVSTPSHAAAGGSRLDPGESLHRGQSISAPTVYGSVTLTMQNDGNLVLYDQADHACWASGTQPNGWEADYQQDGNFVVYDVSRHPLWASNTVDDGGDTVNFNAWGQLWVGQTAISPYCS
ncbi:hypothetical protein [Kitasatospora sp. LaBMicrA B282]|uniref:hypothetical protein n=1 Tax=Kitasatospora sp. LaBMicrA B282 TaxID=3420949 RepID=UPI003D0D9F4E